MILNNKILYKILLNEKVKDYLVYVGKLDLKKIVSKKNGWTLHYMHWQDCKRWCYKFIAMQPYLSSPMRNWLDPNEHKMPYMSRYNILVKMMLIYAYKKLCLFFPFKIIHISPFLLFQFIFLFFHFFTYYYD